jgi:putative protease
VRVYRNLPPGKIGSQPGLWAQPKPPRGLSKTRYPQIWWWLPPVIWPEEEGKWQGIVDRLLKQGARRFVLNSPWQRAFFGSQKGLDLWAGPFCNLANALALEAMSDLNLDGAFVSPELSGPEILSLPRQSPLPLGLVIAGAWPLCLSRIAPPGLEPGQRITSPKKEVSWTKRYGPNTWHYPNWRLDLYRHQRELERAGYCLFAHLHEPRPKSAPAPRRSSSFNWDLRLL